MTAHPRVDLKVSVCMPVFSLILSFSLTHSLARARALSLCARIQIWCMLHVCVPLCLYLYGCLYSLSFSRSLSPSLNAAFLGFLRDSVRRQSVQELVSAARDGNWQDFHVLRAGLVTADLNTVPKGRIWGVIHQVERERARQSESESREKDYLTVDTTTGLVLGRRERAAGPRGRSPGNRPGARDKRGCGANLARHCPGSRSQGLLHHAPGPAEERYQHQRRPVAFNFVCDCDTVGDYRCHLCLQLFWNTEFRRVKQSLTEKFRDVVNLCVTLWLLCATLCSLL